MRMADKGKDSRRPKENETRKTQYEVEKNHGPRDESPEESVATNTNRRKSILINDTVETNKAEENLDKEDKNDEETESDDEGIEDFYIASRKVTNQVEEERDSLKNELRMMRITRDSLEEELKREKREKELMRYTLTSIKKDRDHFREELRAIMLGGQDKTDADKVNISLVENSAKKNILASSRTKSSVSKLKSIEEKVEDKGYKVKTDPENPKIAFNQIVEGDEKKTRRHSIATFSAVKKTRNCRTFGDSCQGCSTPECQICVFCLDHPSRGGKHKLKQKCQERKCRSDKVTESVPEEQVDTELSCDECSQDFRRKDQLKRHMTKTHGV